MHQRSDTWVSPATDTCPPLDAVLTRLDYVPPPAWYLHIAHCAACRATLLHMDDAVLSPVDEPTDNQTGDQATTDEPTADETQVTAADLAAYIDNELAEGTPAARRLYPCVWQRLLRDVDLAETYYLTRVLLSAEACELVNAPATLCDTSDE